MPIRRSKFGRRRKTPWRRPCSVQMPRNPQSNPNEQKITQTTSKSLTLLCFLMKPAYAGSWGHKLCLSLMSKAGGCSAQGAGTGGFLGWFKEKSVEKNPDGSSTEWRRYSVRQDQGRSIENLGRWSLLRDCWFRPVVGAGSCVLTALRCSKKKICAGVRFRVAYSYVMGKSSGQVSERVTQAVSLLYVLGILGGTM